MIYRLNYKNKIDMYEFCLRYQDKYEDWYITKDKSRLMINNLFLIDRILKTQEVYAIEDKEIDGILLIYRTKNYRPYLKILAKDSKTEWNLLRFLTWNYFDEIYAKLKTSNPLVRTLQKQNKVTKKLIFGFVSKGLRGKEVLLYRPKQIKKEMIIGDK